MNEEPKAPLEASPEQIRYADVLEKGMYVGLACLLMTFALYVFGIIQPHIPLESLSEHWTQNVHEYLHGADIPSGWGWVSMLGHGDFVNFIGIVILSVVTIVCFAAIIPLLLKKKDFVYATLALLEVLVLAAAASGIIAVGH